MDIVFDCHRPAALARFWVTALTDYRVAPYDGAELDRLHALGIDDVEEDPTVLVEPVDGQGPRFWFQKVPESKTVKNRVHLELGTDDVEAEIQNLISAGAKELHRVKSRVTLADPEGNEFCVDLT